MATANDRFQRKTAFRVGANASVNIPATAVTTIDFDVVLYDLGDNFDLVTNAYTVPLDGIYFFSANLCGFHQAGGDGRALMALYVGGVEVARGTDNQLRGTLINDRYNWLISTTVSVVAGDIVTARIQNVSGPAISGLAGHQLVYFTGYRIESESRTILGGS